MIRDLFIAIILIVFSRFDVYMRNLLLFLMLIFVYVHALSAQNISFDKSIVNFGVTLWYKPVTVVYTFENLGQRPLEIENVESGCGCIDVRWTKGMVEEGHRGEVSVTYDAKLLGSVDKVIKVFVSGSIEPVYLRLKGKVSASENLDVVKLYPYQIGDVLLSSDNIEFPDVHKGDSASVSFEILNNSNEVYTPQLMHLPNYITAEYSPSMLGRGRRGTVTLKLNSERMVNVGINQANIYLARYSGDKVGEDNDIAVTSVLLPERTGYAEGLLKPKFVVSSRVVELGRLGRRSKLSGNVVITNEGTGVLNIESVAVYNQALNVSLPKRSLVPGESMKMKIVLQSKYLNRSNAQPRVLIITNDPDCQKETVTVSYEK